ncbi:hypothetical protein KUTeg_011741 [Tegillarca granosa]|uniref:Ig-like domain-containing protein n=1 Tax=Tegillarca granosa TaxID=220873 RepID=A0ABQ9EXI1_TEGGR|nr:hypothetical protein KUTeg_011741 [Tegillarca granosa]
MHRLLNAAAYAKLTITGESEYGHVGEDFIFKCVSPTIPYQIYWHRNRLPVASQKLNLNGCTVLVHSSSNYIYFCSKNFFLLRIPGENMTDYENDTFWSCSGDDWSKSNIFHLNVIGVRPQTAKSGWELGKLVVRVSEVFMFKNIQTDKTNDADIVTLSCESNPCRPLARVKWYNGDKEITNNITIQTEKTNTLYLTTSSVTINTTYEGTNNIYCKASNLPNEKSVESNIYSHSSRGKPVLISTIPSAFNTTVGELIEIELDTIAFPTPTVTCGLKRTNQRQQSYLQDCRFNVTVISHTLIHHTFTFWKEKIEHTDFGEYKIVIENGIGKGNLPYGSIKQHRKQTYPTEQKSRKLKAPLLSLSVGTLSGKLAERINHDRQIHQEMTETRIEGPSGVNLFTSCSKICPTVMRPYTTGEWHKSGSDLSGIDMEMFVCISDNMAEYENNGRIKELEADSVYHDLELDDVERTRIEWPYEDIKDNGDQSRSSGFINIEAEDS